MLNLRRTVLAVVLALLTFSFILAYDDGDFQVWQTIKMKGKMSDRITPAMEIEMRRGDKVKEFYYLHADGGVDVKVTSIFSLGFNFRFKQELKKVSDLHPFRDFDDDQLTGDLAEQWAAIAGSSIWYKSYVPHFNGTFAFKFGGTQLKARTRLEIEWKKDNVLDTTNNQITTESTMIYYLREKVDVTLPVKFGGFSPWVANEFFFKLNKKDDENFFYRDRFSGGVKGKVTKNLSLSPYFLLQLEKKKTNDSWKKYYIMGLSTELSFG